MTMEATQIKTQSITGEDLCCEIGIYTHRSPDTVRAADVLFISNERFAQQKSAGYLEIAPELIVEILSPSDRWTEVTNKILSSYGRSLTAASRLKFLILHF